MPVLEFVRAQCGVDLREGHVELLLLALVLLVELALPTLTSDVEFRFLKNIRELLHLGGLAFSGS